jgi:hypothetical protein
MDAPCGPLKPRATAVVLPGYPELAAQKGEAYRKALKARLRAAVPRSLRKATFRIAGMDDPFVQLDSQKLKELEKLEVWLKQHFPAEMECEPVAVPRDKLRQLVDRLSVSFGRGVWVCLLVFLPRLSSCYVAYHGTLVIVRRLVCNSLGHPVNFASNVCVGGACPDAFESGGVTWPFVQMRHHLPLMRTCSHQNFHLPSLPRPAPRPLPAKPPEMVCLVDNGEVSEALPTLNRNPLAER